MGQRAGYGIRATYYGSKRKKTSPILRKQCYWGGSKEDLEAIIKNIAGKLTAGYEERDFSRIVEGVIPVGDGFCALRYDLDFGRLASAMFNALYRPPFDSIETTINCDINDHGLFEIELIKWNEWKINHYWLKSINPIAFTYKLHNKKILGKVFFESGKKITNGGIRFEWAEDFEEC